MKRFLPLLFLAACAMPVGQSRPESLRMNDSTLFLTLQGGMICRADWRAAPVGDFGACAPGLSYEVSPQKGANPVRKILQEVELALDGSLLSPMAEVRLRSASGGEWRFTVPPPDKVEW